ncbi:WD40 repeat-like protein [Pyrenochaeta sp. DS3sAY3a]|nr:WD40 repeat-like protein [Pyrenochaeta sp. DS3sAY3a]
MAVERQSSSLPSAQPSYILRGHASQIHSVQFVHNNRRLLTGDGDGWIVYWRVETKRALAVWKAHEGAILGTAEWGSDRIITHGRDHSLRIWQLRAEDEPTLSTALPAEQATEQHPKPWLLHTLPVNTLNFCAFSMCHSFSKHSQQESFPEGPKLSPLLDASIFIAVPARDDKKIEVYQFPEEKLRYVVPRAQSTDTGMVMAVKLIHHSNANILLVLAGYEGGIVAVHRLPRCKTGTSIELAELVYLSKPHSQPVLSLDVAPDAKMFFSSSADAVVAAHRIPDLINEVEEEEDLSSFERIQITTLPDAQVSKVDMEQSAAGTPAPTRLSDHERLSSVTDPEGLQMGKPESVPTSETTNLQELQDEPLSFAKQAVPQSQTAASSPGGLSTLLSAAPQKKIKPVPPSQPTVNVQPPYKTIDTKHAGQQSLCIRSDGRLLATGGWDTRIRMYSTKTLKEVAVLKWHKEGVYAVAFSKILEPGDLNGGNGENATCGDEISKRETGLTKLQRQREEKIQLKHWVVAGAKDGKVSLWEVF